MNDCGAFRTGVAAVKAVEQDAVQDYESWLTAGFAGELDYMKKYPDIRSNPELLLPDAKSAIVAAFPYTRPADVTFAPNALRIASYALGDDYHTVLRKRLDRATKLLKELFGGEYRVCIDTAPLRERYWAVKAGVGFIGTNALLILPNAGSCFFIGTILTTITFEPDEPCTLTCGNCRRCIASCPTSALTDGPNKHAVVDCRKCLSCLTIEHRGEFSTTPPLRNRLYGCDTCQSVCPHNRLTPAPTPLPEFAPREQLLTLTRDKVLTLDRQDYNELFKNSAMKRAKLDGLQRNARACKNT